MIARARNRRSLRGFSLAETMIAAVIVAFVLLPLVGLLGTLSTYRKQSSDDSLALIFVESVTQTLQNTPTRNAGGTELRWHFPERNGVFPEPAAIRFPPADAGPHVTVMVGDERGRLVRSVPANQYDEGVRPLHFSEAFLVRIRLERTPMADSASSRLIPAGEANSQFGYDLLISVEFPLSTRKLYREKETFYTRVH